jgi:hypothetical protein
MNYVWSEFLVLLLRNPVLLESGQLGEDRAANPRADVSILRGQDVNFRSIGNRRHSLHFIRQSENIRF